MSTARTGNNTYAIQTLGTQDAGAIENTAGDVKGSPVVVDGPASIPTVDGLLGAIFGEAAVPQPQTLSSVSGGGSATATGRKAATSSSSVSGGGSSTAVGRKAARSGTAVTGGGQVTTSGRKAGRGGTSVTGGGSVSAATAKGGRGAAGVSGGGTVSAATRTGRASTSSVSGGGSVATSWSSWHPIPGAITSTSTVTGGGAATAAGRKGAAAASSVTGAGGPHVAYEVMVPPPVLDRAYPLWQCPLADCRGTVYPLAGQDRVGIGVGGWAVHGAGPLRSGCDTCGYRMTQMLHEREPIT